MDDSWVEHTHLNMGYGHEEYYLKEKPSFGVVLNAC